MLKAILHFIRGCSPSKLLWRGTIEMFDEEYNCFKSHVPKYRYEMWEVWQCGCCRVPYVRPAISDRKFNGVDKSCRLI